MSQHNMEQNIHCKQFIITEYEFTLYEDMWEPECVKLENGLLLYYDKKLNVRTGKYGVLIGEAFQGDPDRDDPQSILNLDLQDPSDEYESWNGRWILIYKNNLHMDANGLFTVFYGNVFDKGGCVSSSLALIDSYSENKSVNELFCPLDSIWRSELYWNPGPISLIKGIYQLLPTQILNIITHEVYFRDTINKKDFSNCSVEEIYDRIFNLNYSRGLKRLNHKFYVMADS